MPEPSTVRKRSSLLMDCVGFTGELRRRLSGWERV
jgi:hypothetical protein